MNPQDPFQQQGGGQSSAQPVPQPFPQPSIQPQAPVGNLYSPMPGAAPQPVPQAMSGQVPGGVPGQSPYILPPKSSGSKAWMIVGIALIVVTLALSAGFVWAYLQYTDHRDNVESKVSTAVADAVKEQADKDAADFLKREKEPNRGFVGPDDYGQLRFNYPKTWSTYIDKDAVSGGTFAAYLNPVTVPTVSNNQQFALRVLIEEKDYDKVVESYSTLVKKGDLKSSAVKADDQNGTRLDGNFTKNIKGSSVIFKIRDKTVTVQTDADVFMEDFNALIQTITFNK